VKKGFTLLELIIVIIIVGLLATVGLTQYTVIVEKGRLSEAKANLGIMRKLAHEYYLKNGTLLTITDADVGVGTGLLPSSCVSTNYYRYYSYYPNADRVDVFAARCKSGGKPPQWTGANYCIATRIVPNGTDIFNLCGCGSGCSEIGLVWND
jgi:prepilin-type N-terminal cleavage/methylation domain-containing protein